MSLLSKVWSAQQKMNKSAISLQVPKNVLKNVNLVMDADLSSMMTIMASVDSRWLLPLAAQKASFIVRTTISTKCSQETAKSTTHPTLFLAQKENVNQMDRKTKSL
jgi:hypothetical protein